MLQMEVLLEAATLVAEKRDGELATEKIKIIKTLQRAQAAIRRQHRDVNELNSDKRISLKTVESSYDQSNGRL
jgi:hypothetical protein